MAPLSAVSSRRHAVTLVIRRLATKDQRSTSTNTQQSVFQCSPHFAAHGRRIVDDVTVPDVTSLATVPKPSVSVPSAGPATGSNKGKKENTVNDSPSTGVLGGKTCPTLAAGWHTLPIAESTGVTGSSTKLTVG